MKKTALITGITGQDGSYLAELLLEKDYKVVGLVSQKHNIGNHNISHIKNQLILETGDLLEKSSLEQIFTAYKPQEVYNLAGLTFVPGSWQKPSLTLDINTLGLARLLEIIVAKHKKTKIYQASSSKIFGNPQKSPQNENTPIKPQDPYSISKASAHQLIQIFRSHFNIFAVAGILYNHESQRRGPEFVTRKITQTAVKIKLGLETELKLGDLDAKQDWGYAPDYVRAMWLMLQQKRPEDYIISSGEHHQVKDICHIAFSHLGLDYKKFVKLDPQFSRKEKISTPLGDYSKAKKNLNWQPTVSFETMIKRMVDHDFQIIKNEL